MLPRKAVKLSLGTSLCHDTWCPLALLISSTELLYSSLRRSSPHDWVASSGTSPRYSREWGLKWTLVRPVWPVTFLASWSPERPWPLISSNLLYQDLCLSALGRWKMMGRGSGKAENRPVCCRIVNIKSWMGFSPHLQYTSGMHLILGDSWKLLQTVEKWSSPFTPSCLSLCHQPHQCGLTQTKENPNIWPLAHDKLL